ncbi:hypothetical protein [Aliikangiella maris]|uniref:Uncharacterized protein n=2 Tax=Aliikangiella maris TaxID=3162458 RepID=A0ABV2C017_9GAMM
MAEKYTVLKIGGEVIEDEEGNVVGSKPVQWVILVNGVRDNSIEPFTSEKDALEFCRAKNTPKPSQLKSRPSGMSM